MRGCSSAFALLALLLPGMSFPAFARDSPAGQTVRVGIYENHPKLFTLEDGTADGFFPVLLDSIASLEGWSLEYVPGSWSDCLLRLESGEIDIMPDVAFSEERAASYYFGEETVLSNWAEVYSPDGIRLESLLDLEGMRVAVMTGSIHYTGEGGIVELLDALGISCTYLELTDYAEVFQWIEEGRADAGVVNRVFGVAHENEYDVNSSSIISNPRELRFAGSRASAISLEVLQTIDRHLVEMKTDPASFYYKVLDGYVLAGTTGQVWTRRIPDWVFYAIAGGAAMLLFLVTLGFVLRRRVRISSGALGRSVHERDRARMDLELSERRYRTLFEGAVDALYLIDRESCRILGANPAACRMTGYSLKELTRFPFKEIDSVLGDPCNLAGIDRQIGPEQAVSLRTDHLRKDGTLVPVELRLSYLDIGENQRIYAVAKDITEELAAEEDRLALEDQLAQSQKMEAVGQLASGVAHDFNNLLQAIQGYSELAMMKSEENPELRDMLGVVLEATEKAVVLVRQLLLFSRREASVLSDMDPVQTVRDISSMIRRLIGEHIEFSYLEPAASMPTVKADRGQLEQVLMNLCINARDAIDGHGSIVISMNLERIDAENHGFGHSVTPGSYLAISVKDTGRGMTEDVRPRVFEPFFTTKEAGKGTGLGLSMVYAIVQKHGGFIDIESEPGAGTLFRVFIPESG